MTSLHNRTEILATLASARRVADYALRLGAKTMPQPERTVCDHLGAVLADSILQAGLNYQTVVRVRINRIVQLYPEAATLAGTTRLIESECVNEFLLWKHPEKISRFIKLVRVLRQHDVEDTYRLRHWLQNDNRQNVLLAIAGIGPKTVDYMSCLVGIDCIAVDRHVRAFVSDAGIRICDYYGLQRVVSYAADLLDVSRRDFDSWIWSTFSSMSARSDRLASVEG